MGMSEENIFNVERIVDSRTLKGKKQYFIKWQDFDSSENTWELSKDILCKELIDEFERHKNKKVKKINLDISNEWHNEVLQVDSVHSDNKTGKLMCELLFNNGNRVTVLSTEVHDKCPIKLLEFYEKNINFVEEQ